MLALGVCSFALFALLGLFTIGVKTNKESEEQIQAANLSSLLIARRQAAPTAHLGDFAIPAEAMTQPFGPAYKGKAFNYVDLDGRITDARHAAYLLSCQAGTNAVTGSGRTQIHLMLTWPPQADPTSAGAGHYEFITYIPLP